MANDAGEVVPVVPATGQRSGPTGDAQRPVPSRAGYQLVPEHEVDSLVSPLVRDRVRAEDAKQSALTGKTSLRSENRWLERASHTSSHRHRSANHHTDRRLWPPPAGAARALVDAFNKVLNASPRPRDGREDLSPCLVHVGQWLPRSCPFVSHRWGVM